MTTFNKGQLLEITTNEGVAYGLYAGQVTRSIETFIALDSVSPKVAGWYRESEIVRIL